MTEARKSKSELLGELRSLRERVRKLQEAEGRRKLAAKTLRESESRFHLLVDNIQDTVFLYDMERRLQYVNPVFQTLTGYTCKELYEKNFINYLHPEDEVGAMQMWEELFRGKAFSDVEFRIVTKDGQTKWCLSSWGPLLDEKGEQIGVQGREVDITERKLAEEASKRAEEALRFSHRLLGIANWHVEMNPLLKEFVVEVQNFTGCAAVGLRILDEEGNIPYEAYAGFSRRFYESESPLSIKSDQCMCINVIKGVTDPKHSFYTKGGSFCMNGTTRFLATVSEEEKGRTRNVCNLMGYESVALVPIRAEGRIIGLIHVADPRENMVPLEMVEVLEGAEMQLGTAIQRVRAEEAKHLQRDQLIAHSRILCSIMSTQELDDLLGLILDEALGLLRVEFGSIHLLQKDGLVLRCWRDFSDELSAQMHFFPATDLPNWTRQPCMVHERLSEHGIIPDFAKRDGIQAWASIPLHLPSPRNVEEGEWLGTVLVGSRHYEALNKEKVRMFQGLADELALAIDHARAYRAAHERLARLQILRTIDSAIIQGQDTRVVLRHVVDVIPEGLVADAVAISMLDGEHFRTEVFVMRLPGGVFVEEEAFTLAESLLHWFVERQEPVIIYDLIQDPRVQMHRLRNCIDRLISYLGVPLVARGRTIGILHILTTQPRIFADEDIAFFRTLAGQAAIAIANARLFGEVQQELTERKRAEEALLKFRLGIERSAEAVFMTDPDGTIVYVNPAFEKVYGFSRQEAIGKTPRILKSGMVSAEVYKQFWETLMSKNVVSGEIVNKTKDGRLITIEGSNNPILDESGKILGFLGIHRDITERKRAEEEIQNLAKFPAENPSPVFRVARDGTLLYINEAGLRSLPDWHLQVGQAVSPMLQETVFQCMNNGTTQMLDLECGERLYSFHVVPIVAGGYANLYGRDITERKLAEQASKQAEEALKASEMKYRGFVNNALVGVYQSNVAGDFLFANDAFVRMMGYSDFEELASGKAQRFYKSPHDRERFIQLLKENGKVTGFESRVLTKNGEERTQLVSASLEGDLISGTILDITERKQAEQQLKLSREQLRALAAHLHRLREEERKRMAREFHDQLGQTLTALKMDLTMLQRRVTDKEKELSRTAINVEIQAMQQIADHAIGSIREIMAELRPELLDQLGILATLEFEAESFQRKSGISCVFTSHIDEIQLDQEKSITLFRIFQEALANVARHAKATSVRANIRMEGKNLLLEIKDNGVGISPGVEDAKDSFGIIGMRERALVFGGAFEIRGVKGEGTTIVLRLPLEETLADGGEAL